MSSDKERAFVAACIQFDVKRGDAAANLQAAEAGLRAAAGHDARLAVLPEMWTLSFLPDASPEALQASAAAEQRLAELSRELGMVVVGSAPFAADDGVFNRAVVYDHGEAIGEYRKIHLFSPNAEHRLHEPGDRPLVVDSSLGRMGVVICYDIRFPELMRYFFYKSAEFIVVPAQWPEARSSHWRILLKARAVENELFMIGCNRTGVEESLKNEDQLVFPGDSRIVDPMGEVIGSGSGASEPVLAEIQLRKVRTMRRIMPIAKDGRPPLYRTIWQELWHDS